MSHNPVHTDRRSDRTTLGLESGLEALRESPAFRGPVEPLDGHDSNDHLALVYETREEQFAAAVPFVEQGLDRNERCLYIADENSETEVLDAMRNADVNVDDALESGALTLHTKQDTYCRGGSFDPENMLAFLEAAIEEATEEYEALRIAGEMTWIFGDDPQIEDLVEYEGRLNHLLPDEDSIALCQYNRNRFPAEVLRDIVRTHPHLVYDNTVSHNAYYTPPEEFFGPDRPAREVERMLKSLRDRTIATEKLSRRERELKRQNDRLESFASMLAHELRNPLSIAQIYLEQAVTDDGDAAEEVATALDRIEEMIDVLLVTARTSEADIDYEAVDLSEAAADAWADLSPEGATLRVETDRTIQVDPVHCWHLLENLFSNAVEHGSTTPRSKSREDAGEHGAANSRPANATAERATENEQLSADGGLRGDDATLTVSIGSLEEGFYVADDGSGIPEGERATIFDAGHSTEADGIGLGLTFVARLVETYGWDCDVTESEAGGARFEFRNVETGA
ncbi:MEDS domain-containing protein [Halorussus limi]|uniref:histidine kinase n=1 Tax=Halorussus limi TaxID=2938695 RepID=A0A8U0HRZ7_9EURY|nr:MEDS domain-containing protein [Halorussus limi]UPV73444.1 MEDS domain-containing protein [Halorussus limi]